MSKHCLEPQRRPGRRLARFGRGFNSLQVILWVIWTAVVLGRAYLYVRPALHAQDAADLTGLVIHTVFVGLLGMLVLTLIEMRLEPWRFLDERDA